MKRLGYCIRMGYSMKGTETEEMAQIYFEKSINNRICNMIAQIIAK